MKTKTTQNPFLPIERITRQFYAQFKNKRSSFVSAINGIATETERERYATLMLNRLMFTYFLQKKGFLADDPEYLSHQLLRMQQTMGENTFYRHCLLDLFYSRLGSPRPAHDPNDAFRTIPYLNGSLFALHPLEQSYTAIQIDDSAFEQIFDFFNTYRWSLDDTPPQYANEITPAILGYIFEKHSHQQQMGAYYTSEDVTTYIASNCILPAFFDAVAQAYPPAFHVEGPLWQLLRHNPDRYIPASIRSEDPLLQETEREYQARRAYYQHLYTLLSTGAIHSSDDFITYNLAIDLFAQDVLHSIDNPKLLYVCYQCLCQMTILDPTCGSGAFLFAALRTLTPLYTACLDRIDHVQSFLPGHGLPDHSFLKKKRRYFILKSIIINNIYGVDMMEEATEICKLRLFLTLLATCEHVADIEPLPAIDHHIRTGNALVGFDLHHAPTEHTPATLDRLLAQEYGIAPENNQAFARWQASHQPFHWCSEFAEVRRNGGFTSIIGNPPYVEYTHKQFPYVLQKFGTLFCANLYPCVIERSRTLLSPYGRQGMILPLAAFATKNMTPLIESFQKWFPGSWLSFYHFRPSMLFSGGKVASIPTAIYLARANGPEQRFSTHLIKWSTEQRAALFSTLTYSQITVQRDSANRHYYPKFGQACENAIMEKILRQKKVATYLTKQPNENKMFYRSAGGLYWKVFLNFPWPYRTTSNKQCAFLENYDRDVFVALFNSSLFWWYYTVTFDTFNLKDYMLFGFRFTYPEDRHILSELQEQCERLMEDFRRHAQHLKRKETDSYTIYARKSKAIIDAIDAILARHYGFTDQELDFIIHYDLKYRIGLTEAYD